LHVFSDSPLIDTAGLPRYDFENMEQKQRFFIYDRREVGVLLLLGTMVAIFAFTLGVHLGKRVGPKGLAPAIGETETVPTIADKAPERQQLTEQSKGAQQAADESANQALHDEVARTGIKIDSPRQLQLPTQPRSGNAGATTGSPAVNEATPHAAAAPEAHGTTTASPPHGQSLPPTSPTTPFERRAVPVPPAEPAESAKAQAQPEPVNVAIQRPAPHGAYTLQIGSYPQMEEARDQSESLEALGLKPYMRPAEVKGKRWFRVYVGGFASQEAAEKVGARYVSQHMIEAYVVSKKVD
jgi:DedD protein